MDPITTGVDKTASGHVERLGQDSEKDAVTRRTSEVLRNQENLSYGDSGLKGLVKSPYVFFAAFLASMGGFSFGYGRLFPPVDGHPC